MDSTHIEDLLKKHDRPLAASYILAKQNLTNNLQTRWCASWPEGNDHGPGHIQRVLDNLVGLLGKRKPLARASVLELYLAALAIVAHDIGIIDGREGHAARSAAILAPLAEKNIFMFEKHSLPILDLAIRCHSSSMDIESECRGLPETETHGGYQVRPRFVAALVRLADELDEDTRRAQRWVQEFSNLPSSSRPFWEFCQRISGIAFETDSINFTVAFERIDAGRTIQVAGADTSFIRFFGEKLAKINRERTRMKNFVGDIARRTLAVSVRALPGFWQNARSFTFTDSSGASDEAASAATEQFCRNFRELEPSPATSAHTAPPPSHASPPNPSCGAADDASQGTSRAPALASYHPEDTPSRERRDTTSNLVGILHLSNLYLRASGDRTTTRVSEIASQFSERHVALCVVAVTGDIAFAGRDDEYSVALRFLTDLLEALRAMPTIAEATLVVVPGNHDNDYTVQPEIRAALLAQLRSASRDPHAVAIIDSCALVQSNFFAFRNAAEGSPPADGTASRMHWKRPFVVGTRSVTFRAYNTAWSASIPSPPNALCYPVSFMADDDSRGTTVALLHHPSHMMHVDIRRAFQDHIQRTSDIVLTGRERRTGHPAASRTDKIEQCKYEGKILGAEKGRESEFNIVLLDLEVARHRHDAYRWGGGKYSRFEHSDWTPFARTNHPGFRPRDAFAQFLDDPGAPFSHPDRSALSLRDIYVSHQLREFNAMGDRSHAITISALVDIARTDKKVLVYGTEWSGKTTLGKELWNTFSLLQKVPLLVEGRTLASPHIEALSASRDVAFSDQYDDRDLTRFHELPITSRVLIVDNFDECPLEKTERRLAIAALTQLYDIVVLLADVDSMFSEVDYTGSRNDNPILEFRRFELLPFGHELRAKLIQRWHSLSLGPHSTEVVAERVKQSERIMRSVMATNMVPPLPVFLLAVLQQEESARKPDSPASAQFGSFGYIHEGFVTRALAISPRPAELSTTYQYLSELAYRMFDTGLAALTEEQWQAQHVKYCDEYAMELDAEAMSEYLVRGNIIRTEGGAYSFRYPYLLPFFVAYSLKDQVARFEHYVPILVDNLHVELHSHIITFLSHHIRDERLVTPILAKARAIFPESARCDLAQNVAFLNALNVKPIVLSLSSTSAAENRESLVREQDARERSASRQSEARDADLASVLMINVALKTLNVLGQILKNFPGGMPRSRKFEIARECYALGMRTLQANLTMVHQNIEMFLVDLESILRRTGLDEAKAKHRARAGAYWLTEIMAFALVWKTADCVGHEKLALTYDEVVERDDVMSYKMINLAVRMDHFASVPEKEVTALHAETNGNRFARGVLARLVHRYLFLVDVNYPVQQRLCSLLGIGLPKRGPQFVLAEPVSATRRRRRSTR